MTQYAYRTGPCKKFGLMLPNRGIYSQQSWCAPKYENPTYNNAYIKFLAYLDKHPEITLKECVTRVYGCMKNFDVFKTLVNYGFIDRVDPDAKRNVKFCITKYGKMLLEEAAWSKPVYELVDFAREAKAENAAILSMQITIAGKAWLQDPEFIASIVATFDEHPIGKKHIYKFIPDFDEFVKIANGK